MENFLEHYKALRSQDTLRSPEEREQGKDTRVRFAFTRHEKPLKRPDGLSADVVLPEGIERARDVGQTEDAEYLLVMGSRGVNRARETGQAYMQGVSEAGLSGIINKEGSEGSKLHEYGVYAFSDLDPIQDISKVMKPIFAEGKELIAEGKLAPDKLEAWGTARFMELPDSFLSEQGVSTKYKTASELAHRLQSGVNMSGKLYRDLDVKVNNFTHSPKPECLLQYILQKDGKTGFTSLDEIGGVVAPGEQVEFIVERDGRGELKPIKINFRGETFDCDMEAFHGLVDEYREHKKTSSKI